MRELEKLSTKQVAALAKARTPGRYGDGGGLYLQTSRWGTSIWVFRYQLAGRCRTMGLGSVGRIKMKNGVPIFTADVGLAVARKCAGEMRQMLVRGEDPIDARLQKKQALRAEDAKRITFRDCAEKYIAAHQAGWRNEKHGAQWRATLQTYAYPTIGSLSVAAIDTAHIVRILEPIWTDKTATAGRVRGRIESVLDWATARKFRAGDNPARWRGHLDHLLPKETKLRKEKHHPALPYQDAAEFMGDLRKQESVSARALEFTILTAARTGETINAKRAEFDLAEKVWTVPGERTKSGREHRVPLSDRAVAILRALPQEAGSEWVFPGGKAGAPLSNMAMLELLRGMKGNGLTVHGFRSTFRDWAGDRSNFPREVIEAALSHVIGDAAEAAYRRTDALEKRRRLMEQWSRYCASKPANAANVTPLRKAS